jgi:hypothetical protein
MNLANQKPKDTYKGIVTLTDNAGLTTTLKSVGDGNGGYSPLQLSTTQVAIKAPSFDLGMLDIYESQSITIEYSGIRMRRADGVIRWQLISDNTSDFSIYSGSNKSFSIPAAMQNVYAIGLSQPLDATLRAFTTGAATSPLELSTTQMRVLANQGFSQNWYNSGGTANNRSVWVYQTGASWSLYSRSDANDAGEEFINMTAASSNVQSLTLGKAASPFILSSQLATLASSNLVVGHTAASARLHVRGDGTNPIGRFESLTGTYSISLEDWTFGTRIRMNGFSINENTSSMIYTTTNNGTGGVGDLPIHHFTSGSDLSTSLTSNLFTITRPITPPTGSASFRLSNVIYTINASGPQTGTATGIFLNATETALNGMTHNLMDLQVGGSSIFKVSNNGAVEVNSTTQGFLPPRMNDAAVRAIISPAEGLVVYNTDITHLCIFANGSWHRLVHITM